MSNKFNKVNGTLVSINTDSIDLEKPLGSEYYNISVFNKNMDKIDLKYKEVDNKAEQALQFGVNAKTGMKEAINSKITVPDVLDSDIWDTYIQRVKDIKEGRGNAGTGDVLSGKTFTNDTGQLLTGTMQNRGGAQTVTPGTSNKVLNSGYYSGDITVAGDSDLVASNILSGKNIFGVNGSVVAGKRFASGTVSKPSSFKLDNNSFEEGKYRYASMDIPMNLSFNPQVVIVHIGRLESYPNAGVVNGVVDSSVHYNTSNILRPYSGWDTDGIYIQSKNSAKAVLTLCSKSGWYVEISNTSLQWYAWE